MIRNQIIKLYQTEAALNAERANSARLDIAQFMHLRVKIYSRYAAADYKVARTEMGITDADQYYA